MIIRNYKRPRYVLSFSGGKDSTALLFKLLEKNYPLDKCVCVDTTKEFPEMYDHIATVRNRVKIPFDIVQIPFDYWFADHIKTKGKSIGERGYSWPDMRIRWCTRLKIAAFNGRVPKKAITYIGIAYDERHRVKDNVNVKYPLVDWGITEAQALQYCFDLGFTWGGLYEKMKRVSCFCCLLSGLSELEALYWYYPELWDIMVKMQEKAGTKQFRSDYSIATLEQRFISNLLK